MITVGCDPEFFLQNQAGGFSSAIGVLPGEKYDPIKTSNGAYHVDNVAAEVNSNPADSEDAFVSNVLAIMEEVETIVKAKGYILAKAQVASFTETELAHPLAAAAGCELDYNAYSKNPTRPNKPKSYAKTDLRVVGGHVHIGFNGLEIDTAKLIRTLDAFLTLPMLKVEDPRRRKFYGLAGDFRWKPYGVEYRTPSNVWTYTQERMRWVFRQVQEAVKSHKEFPEIPEIVKIINKHQVEEAENLRIKFNIPEFV